ncbi:MAG: DUF3048 C-terminal domain-containing protein, partial [Clostridia bacterium]|nr:DUF3048 C-terminal domain-containing protein [Clostridia bacterium]
DGVSTWGVGPVRSARVGHCWLREEWNAGFLFYGGQTYPGSSINDVFAANGLSRKTGKNANDIFVLFDGTVSESKSHPWKQYYGRRPGIVAPHNVWADVASMAALISDDNNVPNHAFLFTDDVPESNDFAEDIYINWYIQYSSHLVYDFDSNAYFRYMIYPNGVEVPYEDRDSGELMSFNNVIIQFTPTTYSVADAPTTVTVGEGNADFFMGGVHVAGYWKRENGSSRTVFYGPDGNEMPLQRGRTLIVLFPYNNDLGKTVSYE